MLVIHNIATSHSECQVNGNLMEKQEATSNELDTPSPAAVPNDPLVSTSINQANHDQHHETTNRNTQTLGMLQLLNRL